MISDHATMQLDVLLHFWVIILYWNQSFFIVYPHFFVVYPCCGQQWGYMEKSYKMQQIILLNIATKQPGH